MARDPHRIPPGSLSIEFPPFPLADCATHRAPPRVCQVRQLRKPFPHGSVRNAAMRDVANVAPARRIFAFVGRSVAAIGAQNLPYIPMTYDLSDFPQLSQGVSVHAICDPAARRDRVGADRFRNRPPRRHRVPAIRATDLWSEFRQPSRSLFHGGQRRLAQSFPQPADASAAQSLPHRVPAIPAGYRERPVGCPRRHRDSRFPRRLRRSFPQPCQCAPSHCKDSGNEFAQFPLIVVVDHPRVPTASPGTI